MNKLFLVSLVIFFSLPSLAYVPKFWTISNRVSSKRKSLPIKVVQLVTASDFNGENSYSFKEVLYIKSGDKIKIVSNGIDGLENRLNASHLYVNNEKIDYYSGQIRKSKTPQSFFTPLLYINDGANFRKKLNLQSYIPANALVTPKFSYATLSYDTMPESFTSLSRTNGSISFAISRKISSVDEIFPTVFISQENFQISKIVTQRKSNIIFSGYKEYLKKHWHPTLTTINHDSRFIYKIKTLSVTKANPTEIEKSIRTITQTENLTPNIEAISEFFKIYR